MRTVYWTVMYLLILALILRNTTIQAFRVIGGSVTVVQGGTAVFPCLLTDTTENLTQISWQRKTREIPQNKNFYTILYKNKPEYFNGVDERFSFVGNFFKKNGSLQLSNVRLTDEGTYTCIYTLFPSGNYKTEIPLNVLVPPVTRVKDNFLTEGTEEVAFASCTALGSWPSARVSWLLGNLTNSLRTTTNSTENADGTTDIVSTLFGVPTRNLNHQTVQCVITSPALPEETALPLIVQIHFSPSEVIINERSKNSFECVSDANPKSNISWSRSGQSWPESAVRIEGAVLQILKPDLNGLFQCQASNKYGETHGRLYVHLSSKGACAACWTLFGLLLSFIAIAAALWYYKFGPFLRKEAMQKDNTSETATKVECVLVQTPESPKPEAQTPFLRMQGADSGTDS